ncbi:MAG: hypothetical protein AB7E26_10175 [Chryseobacterium sp.]
MQKQSVMKQNNVEEIDHEDDDGCRRNPVKCGNEEIPDDMKKSRCAE